jgi:Zn-dependent peptidase ImmA (M78 family)
MPKIKSEILLWAREKSLLSKEDAAHKLNIKDNIKMSAEDKLAAIESGTIEPSRSLLLRMSKQYHLPLLTFYLDRPPSIGDRGEDFRTLPAEFDETENINVDILIRDIKARQSTIRETLIDADEENHLDFIGLHQIEDGIVSVVNTIRKILDFNINDFRKQSNHKEAFRFIRQKTESQGIFVLLKGNLGSYHSNIPTTVFRGFVLSDEIAPFIVINDQDSESAWSFTLIHEMTHLILGKTGVSGTYFDNVIEKFCNNVASEFFLPTVEFEQFKISNFGLDRLKSEISGYAFLHKLSSTHIAYRLYKRGDINKLLWNSLREFYYQKWLENREKSGYKNKQNDGGPSYYVVQKYKLGTLVELVQRLTFAGALTTTKAGMLLDIKPLKVHRLFQS